MIEFTESEFRVLEMTETEEEIDPEIIATIEDHEERKMADEIERLILFTDVFGAGTCDTLQDSIENTSIFLKELKKGNDFVTLEECQKINETFKKNVERTESLRFTINY